LKWEFLLGNEGGSESYISLPKNKKEFTEVALEHGEDGSGFMTCIPLPMSTKLIYKMKKIQVFGVKGNDKTELSSKVEITYDSIEDFIRGGYKNPSGPLVKKEQKSLATLTPNDYLWIPTESILSCNGSEIKGKFDRVEVRVTLKDGKTLCTDMPPAAAASCFCMFLRDTAEDGVVRHICICTLRRAFCAKGEARCSTCSKRKAIRRTRGRRTMPQPMQARVRTCSTSLRRQGSRGGAGEEGRGEQLAERLQAVEETEVNSCGITRSSSMGAFQFPGESLSTC